MEPNEQEEDIVVDLEETNEEVEEVTEETHKKEKPKRTPQEEYEYHLGRANRIAKKHGFNAESKPEPVKKDSTEKPNSLDYGQKAFLNSYGIKGSDELALVKQFQDRGFDLDSIVSDDVFTSKLSNLREARETSNAIPRGKGRSAQTSVTDVDLAVAKFQETGELPNDLDTRIKVVDAITAKDKRKGLFGQH